MSCVTIEFEGRSIAARRGESVAAALTAAGVRGLRTTQSGAERGIFCGMGVCQDCLVEIDGRPHRACMTIVDQPMNIRRESHRRPPAPVAAGLAPRTLDAVAVERPEVLVIGAGPGGLAAAIAARRAGAAVLVLDERAHAGGQYFKQLADPASGRPDRQQARGRRLIDQAVALGVELRPGVEVWGGFAPMTIAASWRSGLLQLQPRALVIATGAYERGVPIPGWTLPGVMTTGAAQTLWRCYRRTPGRRVLIAGNGPLNLHVACELLKGGATIAAVAESAAAPGAGDVGTLAAMACAAPLLFAQGLAYRARLLAAGVSVSHGSVVRGIAAASDGLTVQIGDPRQGATWEHRVDAVCLGYGFEPANELARALGCAHDHDPARGTLVTRRDEQGRTSVAGISAVGDCTRLGGALAAMADGTIVGAAAAATLGHRRDAALARDIAAARRELARQRRFQAALWRLYRAPRLTLELAEPSTILCRCEEVTKAELDAALAEGPAPIGEIKRRTRAGMGACQGRYCGPLLKAAIAAAGGDVAESFAPRPPVKPLTIADLARSPSP
jgi:D-hydroxyproline dehydrogenase subunit alpha